MNKTQFKNNFGKYFQQLIHADVLSIASNKTDIFQIEYQKRNRKSTLSISSHVKVDDKGILNFSFQLKKESFNQDLSPLLQEINVIDDISLYEAHDAFCHEQALQFQYNGNQYFYILIYTNMVQSSLEIFNEALTANKFKKVTF